MTDPRTAALIIPKVTVTYRDGTTIDGTCIPLNKLAAWIDAHRPRRRSP